MVCKQRMITPNSRWFASATARWYYSLKRDISDRVFCDGCAESFAENVPYLDNTERTLSWVNKHFHCKEKSMSYDPEAIHEECGFKWKEHVSTLGDGSWLCPPVANAELRPMSEQGHDFQYSQQQSERKLFDFRCRCGSEITTRLPTEIQEWLKHPCRYLTVLVPSTPPQANFRPEPFKTESAVALKMRFIALGNSTVAQKIILNRKALKLHTQELLSDVGGWLNFYGSTKSEQRDFAEVKTILDNWLLELNADPFTFESRFTVPLPDFGQVEALTVRDVAALKEIFQTPEGEQPEFIAKAIAAASIFKGEWMKIYPLALILGGIAPIRRRDDTVYMAGSDEGVSAANKVQNMALESQIKTGIEI